jgi:F5/8 type C domain-containing protein
MRRYRPKIIHTLDYTGDYGDGDHEDHHTVGYLTYTAQQRYTTAHQVTGYKGYAVAKDPVNLSAVQRDRKLATFLAYAHEDFHVCQTAAACTAGTYLPFFNHSIITATGAATGAGRNVAAQARATASSANTAAGQSQENAVDGKIDGATGTDWAAKDAKAGSWLNLTWPTTQSIDKVALFDRQNLSDQVTAGMLSFSDGSVIKVGALPNNGTALTVAFPAKSVSSVRFTISKVSATTHNAGLNELRTLTAS